jgi:hypothetical protein
MGGWDDEDTYSSLIRVRSGDEEMAAELLKEASPELTSASMSVLMVG